MSRENTNNKTENVLEISNLCVEYRTRDSVVKAVNGLTPEEKKAEEEAALKEFLNFFNSMEAKNKGK